MSFVHFEVAPFLSLNTERSDDARLRITCPPSLDFRAQELALDIADLRERPAPWLPILERNGASVTFALPPARGVTLNALWPTLEADERGWVMLTLLKALLHAWPVSMFPRSGVLCDEDGLLWLVPSLPRAVEDAARTWSPWQFDEYCIGGVNQHLTHGLTITLLRLMVEVPLPDVFSIPTTRGATAPSARVAWLAPLDALVAEVIEELASKRPPAAGSVEKWASTLAVLEDQRQQTAPVELGALVTRAWSTADPAHRF